MYYSLSIRGRHSPTELARKAFPDASIKTKIMQDERATAITVVGDILATASRDWPSTQDERRERDGVYTDLSLALDDVRQESLHVALAAVARVIADGPGDALLVDADGVVLMKRIQGDGLLDQSVRIWGDLLPTLGTSWRIADLNPREPAIIRPWSPILDDLASRLAEIIRVSPGFDLRRR
jgi:hypothetical protein